jgi:hypothetical protein
VTAISKRSAAGRGAPKKSGGAGGRVIEKFRAGGRVARAARNRRPPTEAASSGQAHVLFQTNPELSCSSWAISCANTAGFAGILIRPPLTESRSSIVNSSPLNSRFSLFRSVMTLPCLFQDGTIPAVMDRIGRSLISRCACCHTSTRQIRTLPDSP